MQGRSSQLSADWHLFLFRLLYIEMHPTTLRLSFSATQLYPYLTHEVSNRAALTLLCSLTLPPQHNWTAEQRNFTRQPWTGMSKWLSSPVQLFSVHSDQTFRTVFLYSSLALPFCLVPISAPRIFDWETRHVWVAIVDVPEGKNGAQGQRESRLNEPVTSL